MQIQQIKDELGEVVAEMEALDIQEDCKHSNREKQMSIGRKKFNMDPKKGKKKIWLSVMRCIRQSVNYYPYAKNFFFVS